MERYDLVLLDLNLPKKDGMTVLRTLRQTGPGDEGADPLRPQRGGGQGAGAGRGANDYLAKPFILPSWRPASAA